MSKLNVNRVRDLLQEFNFQELFVEELGWNNPSQKAQQIEVAGETYTYKGVASLGGIETFEVKSASGLIPSQQTQRAISNEIAKARFEHVLIFVNDKRTQSVWLWVKREGAKRLPREHHFFKGQPGDLFISKIAAMAVDLSELDDTGHLPLLEAARKVQKALDIERVIKKFFKDYDDQRIQFTKLIFGIPDDRDRKWYASVLLNRLMFIYFLQKKMFINDGDAFYLENKLLESKGRGENLYYSEFLQALFFEAFAKPEEKRSPEATLLTGKIKYLNGGLFLPHKLEQEYKIEVADVAFEKLFRLFGDYSWNLNDIPGESDDDINPDVLGYIFEKYINQKEFGAYYTRPEITDYLCEQTIYRLILDKTNESDLEGLPQGRRFNSVPELLIRLDQQTARKLLHDVLPGLTILDPAVGSGAFLVAALKTLLTVYSAVIGWLRFNDKAWLDHHLRSVWKVNPDREQYAIKKAIITDNLYGVDLMEEATEIAKLRLFMTLVASAKSVDDLEPLPNIDFNILAGNSLIGLMRVEDAEFNAKQRNKDKTESLFAPRKTYREILDERNRKVDLYKHASGFTDDLVSLREDVEVVEREARPILAEILEHALDELGIKVEEATWDESKSNLGKPIKRRVNPQDVEALEPFHWGFEFDHILNTRRGFDAIITNPPWEILKPQDKEFFLLNKEFIESQAQTELLVSKNNMSITEFEMVKNKLLDTKPIRDRYLEYLSGFPHQSSYYRSAPEYANQSAVVNGKRTGTDVNLYKLFVERCFHLLRPDGFCGIVIPGSIYTDLGSTGLRRLLFSSCTVSSCIGLSNEKFIFESVHHAYKICFLSFKKGGKTDQFEAVFRIDPREAVYPAELGSFLTNPMNRMCFSVDLVRKLAPETLAVMEFKMDLDVTIARKTSQFPSLAERMEDRWNLKLGNEFHMTNDSGLFRSAPAPGRLPLYEGKMMHQFEIGLAEPRFWINEKEGRKSIIGRGLDTGQWLDYQGYRLCHRAISGSSNLRTMIVTVLPRNVFAGNSLAVGSFVDSECSESSATVLLTALLDSLVVDYLLRRTVTTNINQHFVYQLPIPRLMATDQQFAPIVRRAARLICTTDEFADLWNEVDAEIGLDPSVPNPKPGLSPWSNLTAASEPHVRSALRSELDALVAYLYGLTEGEFRHILSTFPLVDQSDKDRALDEFRKIAVAEASKSADPVLQELRSMLALPAETDEVEFKETLHWDVMQGNFNDDRLMDVQKAICAMLNRSGGTILIGVQDEGNKPVGIAKDLEKHLNLDKFQRKIAEPFGIKLKPDPSELVNVRFVEIDGITLARVDVRPDSGHSYALMDKVYVRRDGESRELTGPNLTAWWTRRMKGEE